MFPIQHGDLSGFHALSDQLFDGFCDVQVFGKFIRVHPYFRNDIKSTPVGSCGFQILRESIDLQYQSFLVSADQSTRCIEDRLYTPVVFC